jgi:hypothetical protein
VTAAEGDNSHVMQASTQQDEDTSHSHQHLKSDMVTQPAITESEVIQLALTQPSHIIESEEVIAAPQSNMTTSETNAALPKNVMPEIPQPPASSDISTMLQRLLSSQDSQAGHNHCQEGHNQTVANFMGNQLSHNDKQQSFNDKQQNFNDNQKTFNTNLQAFSTKQKEFNDNQEVFNERINQFVRQQKVVNQQLNQALSIRTESTPPSQTSAPSHSVTPAGPLLSSHTNQLNKEHSEATSEDNDAVSSPLNGSRIGGDVFKGARVWVGVEGGV